MKKDGFGSIVCHDFVNDLLEDVHEGFVVKAFIEGEVHRMIGAIFLPDIVDVASAWEIVLKLMEGTSHHPVGEIEGLLNSISMVDVDVDVENPLEGFQQFEDC